MLRRHAKIWDRRATDALTAAPRATQDRACSDGRHRRCIMQRRLCHRHLRHLMATSLRPRLKPIGRRMLIIMEHAADTSTRTSLVRTSRALIPKADPTTEHEAAVTRTAEDEDMDR